MATRTWSVEEPPAGHAMPTGEIVFVCTGLTQATTDVTAPLPVAGYPIRTIQVMGTPGAGGAIRCMGTLVVNQALAEWGVANDPQGNPLTFAAADITAKKLETLLEDYMHLRFEVTAGDGTTSITVRVKLATIARK